MRVSTTSVADRREVVAALLDDDRRQPELAEDPARLAVARGAHLERALGITGGGVHAECDDECVGGSGELGCLSDCCEPAVVSRAGRKRQVEVRSVALGSEAEEVGEPAGARVDVHRRRQHVASVEEQLLRPVAVVGVDVHHGDLAAEARE